MVLFLWLNISMKQTERVKRQITMWMMLASILPSTALCFVFLSHFLRFDELLNIAIVLGGTFMFFIGVVWWWWAICTLKVLTDYRYKNLRLYERLFLIRNKKLESIEREINYVKDQLNTIEGE